LLGAALTAVAGYVGVLINDRREHRKWLRDEKVRVYAAFLKTQADLYSALRVRPYQNEDATEKALPAVQAHHDVRMDLVASAPVGTAVGRLGGYWVAIILSGDLSSTDEGQRLFEDACEDYDQALSEVVTLMRRDLGTAARIRA